MGSSSKMAWSMLLERGCCTVAVAMGDEPALLSEEPLESFRLSTLEADPEPVTGPEPTFELLFSLVAPGLVECTWSTEDERRVRPNAVVREAVALLWLLRASCLSTMKVRMSEREMMPVTLLSASTTTRR